ncbi:MAG: translocation/assembly module TamB domain-containing protein [Synergistales bacterium]|nr:translocation/assembly module TamB domain-containing protein [Synergistales bacterium]
MNKKRLLFWLGIAVLLLAVLAVVGLTSNFGATIVRREARQLAAKQGISLELPTVEGNPIRGFTFLNPSLSTPEGLTFRAKQVDLRLSLLALLRGKGEVGAVTVEKGELVVPPDMAASSGKDKEQKVLADSLSSLPEARMTLRESTIRWRNNRISLEEVELRTEPQHLSAGGQLRLNGVPAGLNATLSVRDGTLVSERSSLSLAPSGQLVVHGVLEPEADATLTLTQLPASLFLEAVRPMLSADLPAAPSGTLSGRLHLSGVSQGALEGELTLDSFVLDSRLSADRLHTTLSGDTDTLEGRFDIRGLAVAGTRLGALSTDWRVTPEELGITDVGTSLLSQPLKGRIRLLFADPLHVTGSLQTEKVAIDQLPLPESQRDLLQGQLDRVRFDVDGPFTAPQARLTLQGKQLALRDTPISSLEATLSLREQALFVNAGCKAFGGSCTFKGSVGSPADPTLDATLWAKGIEVEGLTSLLPPGGDLPRLRGTLSLTAEIAGTPADPKASVTAGVAPLTLGSSTLDKVNATARFQGERLHIETLDIVTKGGGTLHGKGAIDLPEGKPPKLDLTASGTKLPLALAKDYLPQSWSGTAAVDLQLAGSPDALQLAGTATLSDLSGPSGVTAAGIKTRFAGIPPRLQVDLQADSLAAAGVPAGKANAVLQVTEEQLAVDSAAIHLLGGRLTGSGTLTFKDSAFDLKGTAENLDSASLPETLAPLPLQGTLSGSWRLSGTAAAPELGYSLQSKGLTIQGIQAADIEAEGSLTPTSLALNTLRCKIFDGSLSGSLSASPDEKGQWTGDFTGNGSGLQLVKAINEVEQIPSLDLQGPVDAALSGGFRGTDIQTTGEFTSSGLEAYGFHLREVTVPVELTPRSLTVPRAVASLYEGTASADFSYLLREKTWECNVSGRDIDAGAATADFFEDAGSIGGTAGMELSLSGSAQQQLGMNGNGSLTLRDGAIRGFPLAKAAAATVGREEIRFRQIQAPFMMDGMSLTVLPGSRADAPVNDPLFRYITADGTYNYSGRLDFQGEGEVNVQAVKALFGALQGLMEGVGSISVESLQDMLGNVLGTVSKRDYRMITFAIGGTRDKPKLREFQIEEGQTLLPGLSQYLSDAADDQDGKQGFQLKLTIPTGPKTESADVPGTEEQMKEQLLNNLLQQLLQ